MKSNEFLERLGTAGRFTQRSGREAGFSVYYTQNLKERWFSPVYYGDESSVVPDTDWQLESPETDWQLDEILPLLSVHYHPYPSGVTPSREDLFALDLTILTSTEEPEIRPVLGIASVDEIGNGNLLLVRRVALVTASSRQDLYATQHRLEQQGYVSADYAADYLTIRGFQGLSVPFLIPRSSGRAVLTAPAIQRFVDLLAQ